MRRRQIDIGRDDCEDDGSVVLFAVFGDEVGGDGLDVDGLLVGVLDGDAGDAGKVDQGEVGALWGEY